MRKPLLFIIPSILIALAACKKLDTTTQTKLISNDEAATMVAGSLSSSSNGLTTFSADVATSSQGIVNSNYGCGITHVDSVSNQSASGSQTTYNYKYKIVNKLNCNTNNMPDNTTSMLTFSGNFNGPNLWASGSGSTNFTVAGLTPAAIAYAINGSFKSMLSFKLKPDTTRNGTMSVDITVKNLIISKATLTVPCMITSGSAMAVITGNSPKGAFTFNGTLQFNGNYVATLTIAGNNYTINLLTGAVVKQ
jgi:hypothetical protein